MGVAFITVISKILVILLLIAVGYVITKREIISKQGISEITNLLIKIVTPCLIISSFLSAEGDLSGSDMVTSVLMTLLALLIALVLGRIAFRRGDEGTRRVLQFSVTFGNVGFMGVPVVRGVVGEEAVIYASFAIVIFNLFCWTYGYRLMNPDGKMSLKVLLLNPGTIGIAIGLPLYLLPIALPEVITDPLKMIADLNTPLAMIVIGSYVAKMDYRTLLNPNIIKVSLLRLVLAPALLVPILYIIRPNEDVLMTAMIQASMPVAANAVLFAVQYKKDSMMASKAVAATTLFSVVTIPFFAMLAKLLVS